MRYLLMPNTLTAALEDSEDYAEASIAEVRFRLEGPWDGERDRSRK